jgi:hypothetical protein
MMSLSERLTESLPDMQSYSQLSYVYFFMALGAFITAILMVLLLASLTVLLTWKHGNSAQNFGMPMGVEINVRSLDDEEFADITGIDDEHYDSIYLDVLPVRKTEPVAHKAQMVRAVFCSPASAYDSLSNNVHLRI